MAAHSQPMASPLSPSRHKRRYGVNRQIVEDFATMVNAEEMVQSGAGREGFLRRATEGVCPSEVTLIETLLEASMAPLESLPPPSAQELMISSAELEVLMGQEMTDRLMYGRSHPTANLFAYDFIAPLLAPFRNPKRFAYSGCAPFFLSGADAGTFKPDFFAGVPSFSGVVSHSGGVALPAFFMGKAEGNPENDFYRVAIWQAQAISHQEKFISDFAQRKSRVVDSMPVKIPFSSALYVDGSNVTLSLFMVVRWKLRWVVFNTIDCSDSRHRILHMITILVNHLSLLRRRVSTTIQLSSVFLL